MATTLHPMNLDVFRRGHCFERASWVTCLPSACLAALVPQAFRFLFQPITGRRFAAVVAVLRQLIFQYLHSLGQHFHGFNQRTHKHNNAFFPAPVDGPDLFFSG